MDTLGGKSAVKPKTISYSVTERLGTDFQNRIAEYRELFPPGMLPTGVSSRKPVLELEKKFIKFFTLFPDYGWEQIIEATTKYVARFAQDDYKYMKNSAYFISKEDHYGNSSFELASQCDMLGQDDAPQEHFYTVRSV